MKYRNFTRGNKRREKMKKYILLLHRQIQYCQENKNPYINLQIEWNCNKNLTKIWVFFFFLEQMILSSLEEQISQNSRECSEKEEQGREPY